MEIGFTGTQEGMTHQQKHTLEAMLKRNQFTAGKPIARVHHGDCIGSDAQFHHAVRNAIPGTKIKIHPPTQAQKRAWCEGDEAANEYPYLIRNHHIVNETQALIATPAQSYEVVRSGTWATIRYARKLKRPIWIINPDGTVVYTNGG